MSSPITTICRQTLPKGRKFNILTCCTHERYESGLALTGHNFYAWRGPGIKDWNRTYAPLPTNYHLLPIGQQDSYFPIDCEIDLVLSQNKFGQYQVLRQLADRLHAPLISLEHTGPMPGWPISNLSQLKQCRGNMNIFISEWSRKQWGWAENEADVIHHGIETDIFCPPIVPERQKTILTVVNDWINRGPILGFDIWKRVTKGLPVKPVGTTPGLSEAPKTIRDLVDIYQTSAVFMNTSIVSPVPTSLLEAMSCGCAIVTTATCMIPEIIQNGVNGFITNDESHMRLYLTELLNNPDMAREMGKKARETILTKFNMLDFVKNWNNKFEEASQIVFTGER